MIASFFKLLSQAKSAQVTGNHVMLSWSEALALAERGERLQLENEELKRDIAACSRLIDKMQLARLKSAIASGQQTGGSNVHN